MRNAQWKVLAALPAARPQSQRSLPRGEPRRRIDASAAQWVLAGAAGVFGGVVVMPVGAGLAGDEGADDVGFASGAVVDGAGGWLERVAALRASVGRAAADVRDGGTPTGCEKWTRPVESS